MAVSFPIAAIAYAVPSTKQASLYSVVDAAMQHMQKSNIGRRTRKGPQYPASKPTGKLRAIGMAITLADRVSLKDQPTVM